jgi:hypothetical protein
MGMPAHNSDSVTRFAPDTFPADGQMHVVKRYREQARPMLCEADHEGYVVVALLGGTPQMVVGRVTETRFSVRDVLGLCSSTLVFVAPFSLIAEGGRTCLARRSSSATSTITREAT